MSYLGGLRIVWGADLDGAMLVKGVVGTSPVTGPLNRQREGS